MPKIETAKRKLSDFLIDSELVIGLGSIVAGAIKLCSEPLVGIPLIASGALLVSRAFHLYTKRIQKLGF